LLEGFRRDFQFNGFTMKNKQLRCLLNGLLDGEVLIRKHMEVCQMKGLNFTSDLPEIRGIVQSLLGIGEDEEQKNIVIMLGRIEHTPAKTTTPTVRWAPLHTSSPSRPTDCPVPFASIHTRVSGRHEPSLADMNIDQSSASFASELSTVQMEKPSAPTIKPLIALPPLSQTSKKNFSCSVCGSKFIQRKNLLKHERVSKKCSQIRQQKDDTRDTSSVSSCPIIPPFEEPSSPASGQDMFGASPAPPGNSSILLQL
jgi:hypothetical protein